MSIKNLCEKGVINDETESISFRKYSFDKEIPEKFKKSINNRLKHLKDSYIPNCKVDWGNEDVNNIMNVNNNTVTKETINKAIHEGR